MTEKTRLDEQTLIEGLRARDPRSLEALISQYSRELFYFARLILGGVGSAQDAEECLSDLFIVVWQEFESFNPERGSLRAWLTMRTRYIALDCRRLLLRQQSVCSPAVPLEYLPAQVEYPSEHHTYRHEARVQPMSAGVDVLLEQQERREELGRALEQLPELDRLIVYLRYFQLAGIGEIAARTGLSKHAVEARVWRARRALREVLQEPMNHPIRRRRRRVMRHPLPLIEQESVIGQGSEEELSAVARAYP